MPQWVAGDAMDTAERGRAPRGGASLIVHAVNPPGYRNWDELVLPMLDNTHRRGAKPGRRIVLPGTVYNYGPDAFPMLRENVAAASADAQGRDPRRRWSSACARRGRRACARSSCAPATSSARAPATTGSRRGW